MIIKKFSLGIFFTLLLTISCKKESFAPKIPNNKLESPIEIPTIVTIHAPGLEVSEAPQFVWFDDLEDSNLLQGSKIPAGSGLHYYSNGSAWNNPFHLDYTESLPGRKASLASSNKCSISPSRVIKSKNYYISWWTKFSENLNDPLSFSNLNRSDKFIRVWDDPSGNGMRTSWTMLHLTAARLEDSSVSWKNTAPPKGQWTRMEIQLMDHELKAFMNGKLIHHIQDAVEGIADQTFIGLMGYDISQSSHVLQNFTVHLAEIAWLRTPARVELSNSPDWNNGEIKKYLQKTLSRNSNEVSFETYLVDLDTTIPLYAYVLDENGMVIYKQQLND